MKELKKVLLRTVAQLQDNEVDLKDTPALFTWSYPDEPYIQFQMLIKETEQANLNLDLPLH